MPVYQVENANSILVARSRPGFGARTDQIVASIAVCFRHYFLRFATSHRRSTVATRERVV